MPTPSSHVSASSEVLPQFASTSAARTTVLDAYLSPLLARTWDGYASDAGAREDHGAAGEAVSGGV